jgi:hypothetical protein
MQHVRGNVGPELAKYVGQGVSSHGPTILHGDCACGPIVTWIIRGRYGLRDAAPEDLGSVEAIVAVVVRSNQDAGRSVDAAFEEIALALGVVALVLVQDGGQGEDYKVIPVGFIKKAVPVISSVARHPFSQLWMRV